MYATLAIFLILFEAVPEAIKLNGYHKLAASIEWLYRAIVTLVAYFWITGWLASPQSWQLDYPENFWKIIIGYLFLRFALFDSLFNLFTGKPINYIGITKWWDLLLRKILRKIRLAPEHFLFIRIIFLVWGLCWLIFGNSDRI